MKNQGSIVLKERYGKNNYALFKCKTCKCCFSETRGTAFFGLDTPQKEVLRKKRMKYVPRFKCFFATTLAKSFDKVYNFGGFSDGDRFVFVAKEFGAKSVKLAGFDFGDFWNEPN